MGVGARRFVLACALGTGLLGGGVLGAVPASAQSCDGSYPDFCIAPAYEVGDLDCAHIAAAWFTVLPPDPHGFDADYDGYGCESN